MRRMVIVTVFVVTVFALVKTHFTATPTALATVAASMQPGSWATLVTNNIDATLGPTLQNGSSFNILAEGPKLVWDRNSQQLFFFGSDHRDLAQFVSYDSRTNTWQRLPRAAWMPTTSSYNYGMLHGEDHSAIDSASGNYYHREFGLYMREVHRYNVATQTWTDLPLFGTSNDYVESTVGVEFFPDIRSLFIVNGGGGVPKHNNVYLFSEDTQQWTTINIGQSGPGESQRTFARYNPVHHVMVFTVAGYGDRRLFKMDAAKKVTQLKDAPIGLGIMCPCDMPSTLFLADPITGDYIVISKDTKEMWRYDVVTDTWTKLSVQIPASLFTKSYDTTVPNPIFSVAAATIDDLGVQMFVSCDHVMNNGIHGTSCRVNLFKYAGGTAPVSFDFSVANSGNPTVVQGQSQSVTVTPTLLSGTAAPVALSVAGLPAGAAGSFAPPSCAATCSSTLTLTTTASTPTGTFPVVVTGTSGALTRTTPFMLTVTQATQTSGGSSAYDFAALCGQPGVLKCVGFDAAADIAGTYGDNHGSFPGDATPQLDSTVKSTGNSSLKFTIPANSSANSSGSYFTNFSGDLRTQFGENSDFYVQWRQRFSPEFINTVYAGGGGWKQAIIGTGDKPGCNASTSANGLCYSSCTALETVTQNTFTRGFPQMYNSCEGSASHGAYDPFTEKFGAYDFKMQNARPAPYCLYSQGQTNPPTYFPPQGNCFGYFPNEWMTFQVHIKTGPRVNNEFTNSYIQLRAAREGQAGELVLDWGPYNLTAGDTASDQKFGKVWLLPYNTGKSPTATNPVAYTWYDDLIISTQPIAIGGTTPGSGGADTVPPVATLTSPNGNSTVSGTVTVSANVTDNVAVAGAQFQLDGAVIGSEDTTAPYSVSWNTTTASNGSHTLTVAARDAAGNRTTSAPITVTVNNSGPDTSSPVISNVAATTTSSGATVNWTTNKPSDSQIEYGPTTAYGLQTSLNSAMVTAHAQTLQGLAAETTYNFRVKSRDASGNLSVTQNFTLTTTAGSIKAPADGNGTMLYSIPPNGAQAWRTEGTPTALKITSAQVVASQSEVPSGLAIFGYRSGNVLVTEATVGLAQASTSGRIFVEVDGTKRTGLAIANPGDQDANLTFTFLDRLGQPLSLPRAITVAARKQTSVFLHEAPFNSPLPMVGTMTYTSSQPVAVTALRGQTNERGDFLVTTLPVWTSGPSNSDGAIFPEFADGGGWTTDVVLVNPTATDMSGTVWFVGPGSATAGASPVAVSVDGSANSSFTYEIPPSGMLRLHTDGMSDVTRVGSIHVRPSAGSTPAGLVIFALKKAGITVSEASVPQGEAASSVRLYAEAARTGLAIANPTSAPLEVSLETSNFDGSPTGITGKVQIPASGQSARFLRELLPDLPSSFKGMVRLSASSAFHAIGFRGTTNERNEFLITTTPAADSGTPAPAGSVFMFPHMVSGAGYVTEIVLYSRTSGSQNAGTVYVRSQDGVLLDPNAAQLQVP